MKARKIRKRLQLVRMSNFMGKVRKSVNGAASLNVWVVGLHLYNLRDIYHHVKKGTDLRLVAEREESTVSENIAVYYKQFKLGYLPSDNAGMVQRMINSNHLVSANVVELNKEKFLPTRGIKLEIAYAA